MGILDRILGRPADPTAQWGQFQPPIPDFDLVEMKFGKLKFGAGYDAASFLGRPAKIRWPRKDYGELIYPDGGFQMDFDNGKFAYLAFQIGPDPCVPTDIKFIHSKPRLRGASQESVRLTESTSRADLEKLLGAPTTTDEDKDETVISYEWDRLTMEFEFTPAGRLKRWNLFPTE